MLRVQRAVRSVSRARVRLSATAFTDAVDNSDMIVREFSDPYLESLRLVREATEIEHSLMVQYLYAGFSVRAVYSELFGVAASSADSLLGVAIQEMEHLHTVCQLLVALGAAPNLVRQDFPYEPDIYPFPLELEPLTRKSVAKYTFAEAPRDAIDPNNPNLTPEEKDFVEQLYRELGTVTPNRLGSLYAAVISRLRELQQLSPNALPDTDGWVARLEAVKSNGEVDHFLFFKSVFMGTHAALSSAGGVALWQKQPDDPAYPSVPLPTNPSALKLHPNQIPDEIIRAIGGLANLHYWVLLFLLDLHYRSTSAAARPIYMALSKKHMRGPLYRLGVHLAELTTSDPKAKAAVPFDVLSMGYAPGQDLGRSVALTIRFLQEAETVTAQVRDRLPTNFPFSVNQATIAALQQIQQTGAF
jgi:hypothetical protein